MKVLALGIFDGVHAGHQQIISAAKLIGNVTVLTFDPHPQEEEDEHPTLAASDQQAELMRKFKEK